MPESLLGRSIGCLAPLLAQSGDIATSGHGMAATDDRVIRVFVAALIGGFCGLLLGVILAHLVRFLSFAFGRYSSGSSYAVYCAVAGAVAGGVWAALAHPG